MTNHEKNLRKEGASAEEIAENYLAEQGFTIVKKNFHFGKAGEIDIIAREGNVLVFVEVKSRRSTLYGSPESAITFKKQQALRRAAEGYLYVRNITNTECRFDVVAIEWRGEQMEIRHLRNAF